MYKMHIIYLCEYEKFNVPLSRVLEKIYLLKCFSYFPNTILDFNLNLFDEIDVKEEILEMLDLEDDYSLNKHKQFFALLNKEKEKYNLTENDINLMEGILFCYYKKESDTFKLPFNLLNSLVPKTEFDYSYYNAKNKCVYLRQFANLENSFSDSDIENFYKDIENKKLYEFYSDYAVYLFNNKKKSIQEIIRILTIGSNELIFIAIQ